MKKVATAFSAFAIAALTVAGPALAANHVNTQNLTGNQVKQIVQEQGSVLLSTGPDLFDRYVANASYCSFGEEAQAAYVPTANSNATFVGYTCDVQHDKS